MATAIPMTSQTAATEAGPGLTIDFTAAVSRVSMVLVTTGTVTGGVVTMEASHDGVSWVTVEGLAAANASAQFAQPSRGVFRYWRSNIASAITGGGSVTTTFMEAG